MCMIFHKNFFQRVTAPIPLFQIPQKIGLLNSSGKSKTLAHRGASAVVGCMQPSLVAWIGCWLPNLPD